MIYSLLTYISYNHKILGLNSCCGWLRQVITLEAHDDDVVQLVHSMLSDAEPVVRCTGGQHKELVSRAGMT